MKHTFKNLSAVCVLALSSISASASVITQTFDAGSFNNSVSSSGYWKTGNSDADSARSSLSINSIDLSSFNTVSSVLLDISISTKFYSAVEGHNSRFGHLNEAWGNTEFNQVLDVGFSSNLSAIYSDATASAQYEDHCSTSTPSATCSSTTQSADSYNPAHNAEFDNVINGVARTETSESTSRTIDITGFLNELSHGEIIVSLLDETAASWTALNFGLGFSSAQILDLTSIQVRVVGESIPTSSVSEPASLSLLVLGVAGLGFARKRKTS